MNRPLDLIFRLFCLGQLFTCIRPYLLEKLAKSLSTGGLVDVLETLTGAWPPARWCVYLACLAIVVLGARKPLVLALAAGQVLDVAASVWANSLDSGYSEKGLLVLVSVGAAGLLCVDRGAEAERSGRMRAFLRTAASVGFAAIALNKMNADFLDSATSCARVLNEGLIRMVPFVEPLVRPISSHAWSALAMEALLLPLLLLVPRFGVLYAWGFFVNVAMVGPRATTFVFMALALTFLPPADLSRFRMRSRPVAIGAGLSLALATLFWVAALDETRRFAPTQLLPRVSFLGLGLLGIGLLAFNAWTSREKPERALAAFRAGPRLARVVVAATLSLLLVNELSPVLGLKSKYSLTMWSNLRADAGRSNSYVFPEFLRLSRRVDRALLVVTKIRPSAGHALGAERSQAARQARAADFAPFVAAHATAHAHLRHVEGKHGRIRFDLAHDGQTYAFEGTGPKSQWARFVQSTRPRVDWFEDAVMTLGAPQSCLGP